MSINDATRNPSGGNATPKARVLDLAMGDKRVNERKRASELTMSDFNGGEIKGDRTDRLNADELAEGWASFDNKKPHLHVSLRVGVKTDLGSVRENNEDKYDLLEPADAGFLATKGRLYGVADGMGGHSAGQIASEVALKTVIQRYFRDPSAHIIESLKQAIAEANSLIFETAQLIPERQGMGTTLTAVIVREDTATFAHIGDSRAYLIRENEIRQVTSDHSLVAEQVRLGAMSAEEAQASPLRNIILRSIGTNSTVTPDFHEEVLRPGDHIVLCSDGLTGHVAPDEIMELTASEDGLRRGPSVAAYRLVDLANSRGGRDNITVVILAIDSVDEFTPRPIDNCASSASGSNGSKGHKDLPDESQSESS